MDKVYNKENKEALVANFTTEASYVKAISQQKECLQERSRNKCIVLAFTLGSVDSLLASIMDYSNHRLVLRIAKKTTLFLSTHKKQQNHLTLNFYKTIIPN